MLPYTPEQMFDLVADVERYPEFLPWCVGCAHHPARRRDFIADLMVGFKVFRESFTSRVTLHPPDADRRRVHQRPVPLPQQPLAVRADSRAGLR